MEPFLDDGLAVTARDADDGNVESQALVGGDFLHCFKSVCHFHIRDAGIFGSVDVLADEESPYARAVYVVDVVVTVVLFANDSHEEARRRVYDVSAVGYYFRKFQFSVSDERAGNNFRYFL